MNLHARTYLLNSFSLICFFSSLFTARQWPYNRYKGIQQRSGNYIPDASSPEIGDGASPDYFFVRWLRQVVETDTSGELKKTFQNGTIPDHLNDIDRLAIIIDVPPSGSNNTRVPPDSFHQEPLLAPHVEASKLFSHLPYPLDPKCINDKSKWYFRTIDGSCNWIELNKIDYGQAGTIKSRDYDQHAYQDGISQPRDGPNPRAVSNAFFKRKEEVYYEHTPLLLGLIEVSESCYFHFTTAGFKKLCMLT